MSDLLGSVQEQLARYEHPLFAFDARASKDGVEVEIKLRPQGIEVHTYYFLLRERDILHKQFPWTFQRQLYDCLHDYVIEMFTKNPQMQE